tara:strand:- start:281 stop:640 length:360 start_codon:yes stop_codon:yes gene_type:complete
VTNSRDTKEKQAPKSNRWFVISAGAIAVIASLIVYNDKEKRRKFVNLFTSKVFLASLASALGFAYYILKLDTDDEETDRLKKSIKTAIVGFIIAMMAFLDLKIAPFWILFVTSYFLNIE